MNSFDHDESPPDATDEPLHRALRSLPTPETPAGLESRVEKRLRRRRVRQVGALGSVAAILLVGLFVWQPRRGEPVVPAPNRQPPTPAIMAQTPPEIPARDLEVLFAPPPVDGLAVLAHRDAASVAALSRMGGMK